MDVSKSQCVCVFARACICMFVYACMNVCMYSVCAYLCMYVREYMHVSEKKSGMLTCTITLMDEDK